MTQADLQHDYDLEFVPNANNFSERGEYYFNMYCECDDCSIIADFDDLGGFAEESLMVTTNGEPPAEDNTLVMFIILFFLIAGLSIYVSLRNIEKLDSLDMTLYDVVLSFCSFFIYLAYFYFAYAYWGDAVISDLLEVFLWVVGFMNLFVCTVIFGFTIIKRVGAGQ